MHNDRTKTLRATNWLSGSVSEIFHHLPLHFTASCFVGHGSHFTATQAEERSADDALLAQRNGECAHELAP
ncbi:hypothetical protein RB213_000778 [Colletotrichum asianum]